MVKGLDSLHKASAVPSMHELGVVIYNCNLHTGKDEAGRLGIQGLAHLHRRLKVSQVQETLSQKIKSQGHLR